MASFSSGQEWTGTKEWAWRHWHGSFISSLGWEGAGFVTAQGLLAHMPSALGLELTWEFFFIINP